MLPQCGPAAVLGGGRCQPGRGARCGGRLGPSCHRQVRLHSACLFPASLASFSFSRVVAMCTMPQATQPHTCATGCAGEGLPQANPSVGGGVSRGTVLSSPTWTGLVLGKPQTAWNELGKGLGLRQPGVSSLPHHILALTLCRLPDPSEPHDCNFLTAPPHRVVEGTIWEAYKVCT